MRRCHPNRSSDSRDSTRQGFDSLTAYLLPLRVPAGGRLAFLRSAAVVGGTPRRGARGGCVVALRAQWRWERAATPRGVSGGMRGVSAPTGVRGRRTSGDRFSSVGVCCLASPCFAASPFFGVPVGWTGCDCSSSSAVSAAAPCCLTALLQNGLPLDHISSLPSSRLARTAHPRQR